MNDRFPMARTLAVAAIATLALAGCQRGSGKNDSLADGTIDTPSANSGATNAGPSAPPVNSAGPASTDAIPQPSGTNSGAATGATLTLVSQGSRAPFVANSAGNALYYVDGDRDGSKCTDTCMQTWPPVTIETQQPTGAAGLEGAKIATITRPDGTHQVTFEGHPLYRYAADASAGSANGDGVKDKFGSWHVAAPSGAATSGSAAAPMVGKSGQSGG